MIFCNYSYEDDEGTVTMITLEGDSVEEIAAQLPDSRTGWTAQ